MNLDPAQTIRRRLLIVSALAIVLVLVPTAWTDEEEALDLKRLFHDHIPDSPFVNVVYGYANTMLEHGRDTSGPRNSGLFLGALHRKTLVPLTTRPPAPAGVLPEERPGPANGPLTAANPQLDQNLLRLLYFLRGLSGEDRYPQAADQALEWFLVHTASPATGLYPWGRQASWDVVTGAPSAQPTGLTHEFHRPWLLWNRCYELAPEESKRFALALWQSHIADPESGALDPRVDLHKPTPRVGLDSPRHVGFFIRTWAEAYAYTGDPVFLTAIDAVLGRHERQQRSQNREGKPGADSPRASSFLSLAIDLDGAARKVPVPSRERLGRVAAREDQLFCSLPHPLASHGGFAVRKLSDADNPAGAHTPLWGAGSDKETTARVGMMCVSRYQNTGQIACRDLMIAAADAYLASLPGEGVDAWPGTFGHVITLELAAYRATANRRYFTRAFRLGEVAVEQFFGDSTLPKASLRSDHYENTTGADTLVLALAELHLLTRTITVVQAPANTID
jgi:hypothetical protein